MPVVYKEDYSDAEALLNALSSRAQPWVTDRRSRWIFRGQGDAAWSLIPTALRPDGSAWLGFKGVGGDRWLSQPAFRLEVELNVVWLFALEADRQGLAVPGFGGEWMGPEVRTKFDAAKFLEEERSSLFPPSEWAAMFGMAQHYGVPTRLLDWTETANVAAYFAAKDAARSVDANGREGDKRLAVWALDLDLEHLSSEHRGEIQVVRAPWATNPNLRAQRGLFTVHRETIEQAERRGTEREGEAHPIRGLEELATNLVTEAYGEEKAESSDPRVRCLQLPWEEAPSLLDMLGRDGFSGASMFPGYGGVTTGLRERRLYSSW